MILAKERANVHEDFMPVMFRAPDAVSLEILTVRSISMRKPLISSLVGERYRGEGSQHLAKAHSLNVSVIFYIAAKTRTVDSTNQSAQKRSQRLG